ncbi:MAG: helicase RepA family protein, partial [Planctomycetes bacterium]|nr:helicase RepA family protein [Planctomycetota bacterium]
PEPFPDPDRDLPREPVGAEWDSPEHLVGRRAMNGLARIYDRIGDEYEANIALMAPPWPGLRAGMAGGFMPGHVTVLAGPPGVSKSYFALNILDNISGTGIPWRLLPLEDDAQTWVMKMLAVIEENWRIVAQPDMDNDDERILNADIKKDAVEKHLIIIRDLFERRIAENPRNPIHTAMGMVVPDVSWTDVLDYVQREGEAGVRMICIDPMSQINFGGGGQEYRNQEQFVSRLVAAAAGFGVHVLLVAHTVKQARHLGVADTLEGIQGSAMLTRLAHNVLVLSRHNEQGGLLMNGGTARHRLTLGLPKCRNGFSGTRYAFDLAPGGPCFTEYGVLQ